MVLAVLPAILAPFAYAEGAELTIITPDTPPKKDDVFEIKVNISNNPGLAVIRFTLAFDSEELTCLSAAVCSALKGASVSAANQDADDGAIIAAASLRELDKDGEIGYFRFKANEDLTCYIAELAKNGIYWAFYNGIISGSDGNLFPENGTTIADVAKIIVNYLEIFRNKEAVIRRN